MSAPLFCSFAERDTSSPGFRTISPTISSGAASSPSFFSAGTFNGASFPLAVAAGAFSPPWSSDRNDLDAWSLLRVSLARA